MFGCDAISSFALIISSVNIEILVPEYLAVQRTNNFGYLEHNLILTVQVIYFDEQFLKILV